MNYSEISRVKIIGELKKKKIVNDKQISDFSFCLCIIWYLWTMINRYSKEFVFLMEKNIIFAVTVDNLNI